MKSYVFWIIIGAVSMLYWGFVKEYVFETLLIYILIYKPLIDFLYIKKRKLYEGKNLWLKYPFWGYGSKLLFGK